MWLDDVFGYDLIVICVGCEDVVYEWFEGDFVGCFCEFFLGLLVDFFFGFWSEDF